MALDIQTSRMNGMTPFPCHQSATHERLDEAAVLCQVLADAALQNTETLGTLNEDIQSNAFRAIGSLIEYAAFHMEAAEIERRTAGATGEPS